MSWPFKRKQNYVSELDQLLQKLNRELTLTDSQRREKEKHDRVFYLRDRVLPEKKQEEL